MILSPRAYAIATELLGLPKGTPLTVAQVYEASVIELRVSQQERSAAIRRAFANNGVQSVPTAGQLRAIRGTNPKE